MFDFWDAISIAASKTTIITSNFLVSLGKCDVEIVIGVFARSLELKHAYVGHSEFGDFAVGRAIRIRSRKTKPKSGLGKANGRGEFGKCKTGSKVDGM